MNLMWYIAISMRRRPSRFNFTPIWQFFYVRNEGWGLTLRRLADPTRVNGWCCWLRSASIRQGSVSSNLAVERRSELSDVSSRSSGSSSDVNPPVSDVFVNDMSRHGLELVRWCDGISLAHDAPLGTSRLFRLIWLETGARAPTYSSFTSKSLSENT